ncbi:MAG: hypothetical protein M3376_10285 [Actinomycetota bacterium]|nr:hypothetical protein [Actinomycetota bacterium]
MPDRITAALTRRRLGGAVLLLAGIIVAAIVLWPSGTEQKATKPLPIRIVSVPPLGLGFAHPRTWKRTVDGQILRLASPDGSLLLIFSSPFDRPGTGFAKSEAKDALLKQFAPAKIVRDGRSPLGRAGNVQSFELTGERDQNLVRALVHVDSSLWRTYVVTLLSGENPSRRRLAEARRILETVSFSKPRKI